MPRPKDVMPTSIGATARWGTPFSSSRQVPRARDDRDRCRAAEPFIQHDAPSREDLVMSSENTNGKPAKSPKAPKLGKKHVYLVASGDLRLSANQKCWPAQKEMEEALTRAIEAEGYTVVRAH